MNESEIALWWARVRAAGPQLVEPGSAFPAGMARLAEPGVTGVWLLPVLPDGARPGVTDELGIPLVGVDHPNDTARVLAACLRCCWPELSAPVWPGAPASKDDVASVFRVITGRDEITSNMAVVAAIRRLSAARWLLWDEHRQAVRLGPRVASWSPAELSTLRELWRMLPFPAAGDGTEVPL